MASIYLIGICGTGVGALAGLLKALGHKVRGSDANVYPPMSTKLQQWGIEVAEGYDAAHLLPAPDLVICGNVIRRDNPEAAAVRAMGLKTMSMPQAVAEFGIGAKHSMVVAGTHGKTTTTALLLHLLKHAGCDPSYLVGGALLNYSESFHVGQGAHFVIEGDEYDTAYFDKGPKFWHYRPRTAVITSLEFDHADIFASIEAVEQAFAGLIERVPQDGHIVVWAGATCALRLLATKAAGRRVSIYATEPLKGAHLWLAQHRSGPQGLDFELVVHGESLGRMQVPLWGEHAAANVLAACACAREAGLSAAQIAAGCATFAGVRRRMEVRGEVGGVVVVDDFAHHPTAVRLTLEAARLRWPQRRLVAAFEPRSATSRRNVFQHAYVDAFLPADWVLIGSHARLGEIAAAQRFDPELLAQQLCARGTPALCVADPLALGDRLVAECRAGDVVMVLSNGDFGGLHAHLLAALPTMR